MRAVLVVCSVGSWAALTSWEHISDSVWQASDSVMAFAVTDEYGNLMPNVIMNLSEAVFAGLRWMCFTVMSHTDLNNRVPLFFKLT